MWILYIYGLVDHGMARRYEAYLTLQELRKRKHVESSTCFLLWTVWDLYHLVHLICRTQKLCWTSETSSAELHLRNQQPEQTLLRQGTHNRDGGQTAAESKKRNGQHYQVPGSYTPNNRCRPEAPLTSLPKLTPVKNDEDRKREGERRNKTRFKKKNHKR